MALTVVASMLFLVNFVAQDLHAGVYINWLAVLGRVRVRRYAGPSCLWLCGRSFRGDYGSALDLSSPNHRPDLAYAGKQTCRW
jgi:hypothetical protein